MILRFSDVRDVARRARCCFNRESVPLLIAVAVIVAMIVKVYHQ